MKFDSSILRPGDALLYFTRDPFDYIIALKTWEFIAHVEVYIGNGMSVASRNGLGVNQYALRTSGLACVRRPNQPFDLELALRWFNVPYDRATGTGIRGQAYDWLGLMCFTLAVRQGSPHKMFCSEFATRFYRKGRLYIVADDYDADHVAPAQFLQTPAETTIWKAAA